MILTRTSHNTHPGSTLGMHIGEGVWRGGEPLRREERRKESVLGRGQSPRHSSAASRAPRNLCRNDFRGQIDLQGEPCALTSSSQGKACRAGLLRIGSVWSDGTDDPFEMDSEPLRPRGPPRMVLSGLRNSCSAAAAFSQFLNQVA